MKAQNLALISAAIAASLLVLSCSSAPAQSATAPKAAEPGKAAAAPAQAAQPAKAAEPAKAPPAAAGPKKLTVAYGTIPITGDPAYDTGATAMDAYYSVFDTLVVFRDGKLQPSVAESWRAVSDKLWEFKIRKGIKFQNGEPMNAEAVKFSIDRMVNPANKVSWSSHFYAFDKTEIVDEYTVRVSTKEVFAPLAQKMLIVALVPPKYFQEVGKEKFAKAPIGSGPFKFKEMDPLTHFTVIAWPESWQWAGKKPGLDEITWKKLPEDATRVAALQTGEVDVAGLLPPEQVAQLKAKGINIIGQPIAQTFAINTRVPWDTPLKDKRVRQALNYAVDKEAIIKNIFLGYATLSQGQLIGEDAFGFNPNVKAYPYDPAKAKQLLAEAGFHNGFEITFHAAQGRYPKDKESVEVIVAQLAQVGVKAKVEYLENAVYSTMSSEGKLAPLHIYGWQYMPAMDLSQPLPNFLSGSVKQLYANPEADKAIADLFAAMDPKESEANAHRVAEILREDPPAIFLWQFHSVYGIHPYVKGYVPNSSNKVDMTKVTVEK